MDATAKVMIAVPTAGRLCPESERSIRYEAARYGAPMSPFMYSPRDVNRNRIVQVFLDDPHGFEWLLMVDDDTVIPPETVDRLLAVNKPLVFAPYPMLINGLVLMSVAEKFNDTRLPHWPSKHHWNDKRAPYRIWVAGTGCFLSHRSVYERMEWPWFVEDHGDRQGKNARTEDVLFCEKAWDLGIEAYCEPSVVCDHVKPVGLMNICTTKELELNMFVKNETQAKQIEEFACV